MPAECRPLVLSLTVQRVNKTVYVAVLEDVTTTVSQERTLVLDQQRFRAIFDNVRDYAIYITLHGLIEEWNQSLQRFGGWSASDVEGRHVGIFFPSDDSNSSVAEALAQAKLRGSVEMEGWLLKRDDSRLWVNTIVTALPDETGAARGFVVVALDMTKRKRAEDDLQQLDMVDPLTSAFNRPYGHACLTAEFERRSRSAQPFAVLMLDIDWFKSTNDTYGHDAGDGVLSAIVHACNSHSRARYVGALGWRGVFGRTARHERQGAVVTAERLRESLAAMQVRDGDHRGIAFTVSIGVAVPTDDDDLVGLLRRGDQALYAAETSGRNKVVLAV
jgi:diguanylate cyclase (GGDEF)-like protein/PAS domain S-box-containing protein